MTKKTLRQREQDFWTQALSFADAVQEVYRTAAPDAVPVRLRQRAEGSIALLHTIERRKFLPAYEELRTIVDGLVKLRRKSPQLAERLDALLVRAESIQHDVTPLVWRRVAREWFDAIVVALVLAAIVRHFGVQAFKIPTGSMKMTLIENDIILVNKFIYGVTVPFTRWSIPALREPARGDVIVFRSPVDPKKDFIKRVVGLPGETVSIRSGTIYIDGKPLLDPQFTQRFYYNNGDYAAEGQEVIVPADGLFVLGDNSRSSQDSRFWGFVPRGNVLGKALVIYWPPQRLRIIK